MPDTYQSPTVEDMLSWPHTGKIIGTGVTPAELYPESPAVEDTREYLPQTKIEMIPQSNGYKFVQHDPKKDIYGLPVQQTAPTKLNVSDMIGQQVKPMADAIEQERALGEQGIRSSVAGKIRDIDTSLAFKLKGIDEGDADPQTKAAEKAKAKLQAEEKKALVENSIRDDLDSNNRAAQAKTIDLALKARTLQTKMDTVRELGNTLGLPDYEVERLQAAVMGVPVSVSTMKPKDLTPKQRLAELIPTYKDWQDRLSGFRVNPKTGAVQVPISGEWTGGTTSRPQPADDEWQDADPVDEAEFWRLRRELRPMENEILGLRRQIAGHTATDLSIGAARAASPVAQTVTGQRGARPPMYARNPTTGQRLMSTDGGKTWQTTE